MLHGHVLGNKNIIVEYSSDTKDRLGGKSKDMPVDSKLFKECTVLPIFLVM